MATGQATRTIQMVVRAQQGDPQAFADLYAELSPTVFHFLRRRLDGPDAIVEDLTADVFVKLYEKLNLYADHGVPFSAWLFRMARNCLIDYVRKQSRLTVTTMDDITEAADPVDDQSSQEYGQILDRDLLEPALARLTPEQRQVVELRFLRGLSVADVAIVLGRTEDAVKKLQARGLMSLRRILTTTSSPTATSSTIRSAA